MATEVLVVPLPLPLTVVDVKRPVTRDGDTKRSAMFDVLIVADMTLTQPVSQAPVVVVLLGQETETGLMAAVAFELGVPWAHATPPMTERAQASVVVHKSFIVRRSLRSIPVPSKDAPMTPLHSRRHEVADALDANELFQRNGWTGGLPIVPPTESRVQECLDWVGLSPADVIGTEPVRGVALGAEKVAVNAVAAGCLAPYFPVVVTAIQAMCDPAFLLHGATASNGDSAILLAVNGPIRSAI